MMNLFAYQGWSVIPEKDLEETVFSIPPGGPLDSFFE